MTMTMTSNKPYIIKAFYDWISDNQLTPYIAIDVNVYGVLVPMAYVTDGQIVLNIAMSAVGSISMGDEMIELSARFGGKLEQMVVPYGAISAIYAKENGAGTSLAIEHPPEQTSLTPAPKPSGLSSVAKVDEKTTASATDKPAKKSKASLKVIK
jgi:stringent starvation protein B